MTDEPTFPAEAAVGEETALGAVTEERRAVQAGRKKQIVTGAAIGIGSAAIVAALLYANRSRKHDKGDG